MRCIYCNHKLLEKNQTLGSPITVISEGAAHNLCFENFKNSRRIFRNISMKDLSLDDLYILKEMAASEINDRTLDDNSRIEMF